MKRKPKILRIFIYLCLLGYVLLTAFLIYQASLDGEDSSAQSGAVGGEIADAINKNEGDQTKIIVPTDVNVLNLITEAYVGDQYQIEVEVLPKDATYKSLVYESSDGKIASVSSSGLIKFVNVGEVTITVSSKDYPELKEAFSISVSEIDLDDFSISLEKDGEALEMTDEVYHLDQYEAYEIISTFEPLNASVRKIEYEYNQEFINISNDIIVAKNPTNEPIIIKLTCDEIEKEIKLMINEIVIPVVELVDYNINNLSIEMIVNQNIKLSKNPFNISFIPEDATNQNLIFVSKNTNVIRIESGSIKAIGIGTAQIEITSEDKNIQKEVEVTVNNLIELNAEKPFEITQEYLEYDLEDNIYHIRNGYSGSIVNNFTDNTTYTTATFTSSDTSVLLVGDDGVFTPIKTGNVTITVTIDDGVLEPVVYTIDFEVEKTPLIEDLVTFFYMIRKGIGHFGAFLVLGILGSLGLLLMFDKKKWIFSIPLNIVLGFGIAGLTEYIQTFVPGRSGNRDDVWLDFSGFMTAASIITVMILLIYFHKYIKCCKNKKL